jgi:hypothetical protein
MGSHLVEVIKRPLCKLAQPASFRPNVSPTSRLRSEIAAATSVPPCPPDATSISSHLKRQRLAKSRIHPASPSLGCHTIGLTPHTPDYQRGGIASR